MVKQPGHLTSMKKERGAGTSVWRTNVSSGRTEWQCRGDRHGQMHKMERETRNMYGAVSRWMKGCSSKSGRGGLEGEARDQ